MRLNIADLIREMMNNAGLSDLVDPKLDEHSTVTFSMKEGIPSIHIVNDGNNEVWIWATLGEFNLNSLIYYSAELLPLMLMNDERFFVLGQPCLYLQDDALILRAMVKDEHLYSSDAFSICLDSFLRLVQKYKDVLI
ncbi:TPA: hypothetical protein J1413_004633 [Escherichia coli]|nr:hypothetical protein [Escherichia coli]HBA9522825.1 hypothetical protein [Escherichia coli]HBA9550889.1 hypothetical protein [Escherichia coli]HBA9560259.1 hypothetical protein [Escherichia coli]